MKLTRKTRIRIGRQRFLFEYKRVGATQAVSESDSFGNTYDEKAPVVLAAESASYGTHEITRNMQASGRFGALQAERTAQFTINADVYAVYSRDAGGTTGAAGRSADGDSRLSSMAVISVRSVYLPTTLYAI